MGALLPSVLFSMMSAATGLDRPFHGQKNMPALPEKETKITILNRDAVEVGMNLEEYIVNVVLGEISSGFNEEAIKAQAVAARTYTMYCLERGNNHGNAAVCTDYRCCQAYCEPERFLSEGGTEAGLDKVRRAVSQTAGEVLYYNDELICATYFASSGGMTEDAQEVWGESYPYLMPVPSPGEEDCGYFSETVTYTGEELQEMLGVSLVGEPGEWFGMVTHTPGGAVDLMRIGGKLYTGVELRKILKLRSTIMTMTPVDNTIVIDTKGYGHRVGMSQHGANAMAKAGSDYSEILTHYYTGVTLGTL